MNADLHMSDDLKNTGKGNLIRPSRASRILPFARKGRKETREGERVDVFPPEYGEFAAMVPTEFACWLLTVTTTKRASSSGRLTFLVQMILTAL